MRIPGYQRRHLRGVAHALQPVVHLGRAGLSDTVLAEVERALDKHELIKVRMPGDKREKRAWVDQLESDLACGEVGLVGHIVTLYRQHPDPEKRKIRVPTREPD